MKKCFTAISLCAFIFLFALVSSATKDAAELYKNLQNSPDSLKSKIYCDLAFIFLDSVGNKSVIFSEKALSYAKKYNDDNDISYAYIMMGSSMLAKSEYSKALDHFLTAFNISKKSENYYQLHTICNNIGIVYKYTGEYNLALKYYSNALNYARQANDLQSIVQSLTNIGNIYVITEDNEKGLNYYKAAISECQKSDIYMIDIPNVYNNIGYIYFIEKKYSLARDSYNQAYLAFDSLNNTFGQAIVLNNLAEIEIITGNYDQASQYINSADSLHKLMEYNDSRKNLYFTTYQLYLNQKDYKRALEYFERYQSLKDSIYTIELEQNVEEIKTQFEVDIIKSESDAKDDRIKQKNIINLILISVLLLISVLSILLVRLIKQKTKLNTLLAKTNDNLKLKDDEIDSNLLYARRIQSSCMSNNTQELLPDHFVLDLPKFKVGGDFYLIRQKENETIFAVGDSTGHGISGGFLSVLGIDFLNHAIQSLNSLEEIVNKLNYNFYEYITKSKTLRNESISLSIIKIKQNTISYSGSRHYIYKYDYLTKTIIEYKTSREIIGNNQESNFTQNTFEIAAGDWVFLFSDGYADQFGEGIKGKMKYNSFRNHLIECTNMATEVAKNYLVKNHLDWRADIEQTDDILVIGIKF